MEDISTDRELACVLFPGIVKNEERAIQCLGGMRYISQVYSMPNIKRLGLNYQPENPYVKRIFATLKPEAGVLLKVKVKKKRENNVVKREVISTSVVGRVKKIFKFDSLCDFQYMPVQRAAPSEPCQCLLDLLPTGTQDVSVMTEPSPLCVTPSSFTRADRPSGYAYTEKRYLTPVGAGAGAGGGAGRGGEPRPPSDSEGEVHHRRRKERAMPAVKVEFSLTGEFPSEPHKQYLKAAQRFLALCPDAALEYRLLHKCFAERPVWSQNLLKYSSRIRACVLKHLLPCVAYHMRSGPWRSLWLRYGYDPRAGRGAARFQVLDFRLRHRGTAYNTIQYLIAGVKTSAVRTSNWRRADRVRTAPRRPPPAPPGDGGEGADGEGEGAPIAESVVRFRPGLLPAQRQTFYMYCDIELPEVAALLPEAEGAAEGAGAEGAVCHPSRGWLRAGADAAARAHIMRHVRAALLRQAGAGAGAGGRVSSDDAEAEEEGEGEGSLSSPIALSSPAPDEPSTSQHTTPT